MVSRSARGSRDAVTVDNRRQNVVAVLIGAVFLVSLLIVLVAPVGAAATGFPDVPATHPYSAAITDLASRGVIGGYTNGSFGVSDPVTRQQFAKMIVLTCWYGVSESDVCPFTDVQKSDASSLYPDNYIAVCAAHGVTTGTSPTVFAPTNKITRYQMVSMTVRAANDLWPGLLTDPPAGWTGNTVWSGNPTHGANAAKAEYNGLLTGLPLDTLRPTGDMTRGEVAQVLYNLRAKLSPAMSGNFENLGGVLDSSPEATSWAVGVLHVYARGTNGHLMQKAYNGSWDEWQDLGGEIKAGTSPTAVSWGPNRIDVFVTGTDSALWHKCWTGSAWSGWQSLGGVLTSSPGATSWGPGILHVFARGADGHLMQKAYAGDWGGWQDLGGDIKPGTTPAAVSWGPNRIDVFATGTDAACWHKCWTGSGWSGWENLGGVQTSSPGATSWGVGILHVYVRGTNGHLMQKAYSGNWDNWQDLGGVLKPGTSPTAVSWGPNRIDVFITGTDDALYHRCWTGSKWVP
jgi:hypothetical protein